MRNSMKTFAVACIALFCTVPLQTRAATDPASISRDYLLAAENLNFLSVGINYEDISRELWVKGRHSSTYMLDARAYSGYIGCDVVPWWTVFVTVGSSEMRPASTANYFDSESKWSLGMNLNLWSYDVRDPEFMTGRISFRTSVERSSFKSQFKSSDANSALEWSDLTVIFPFGYELYADAPGVGMAEPFSLALSAGPVISLLDGDARIGGVTTKYEARRSAGVMGGADIFLSHNLSFGCRVHYFDDTSVTGTIRYHF